jgi:hypothetical protein
VPTATPSAPRTALRGGQGFIGGFDVIRAENLDDALLWSGKRARILGGLPVEVRPVAASF